MRATMIPDFDVARARGLYLPLGSGTAYLEGPLSALQPESVIRAIVAALRTSPTQPGGCSARSRRSAIAVQRARRAFADLAGGDRDSVVLAATPTVLHLHLADIVSRDWRLGDQIVVSRLDSDALLTPWLRAARTAGASVRWAEVDLETGEVPSWQYEQLIGRHTRLVTVPIGNAATGTVPDVAAVAERAHQVGALVLADAGVAAVHQPLDLAELSADLITISATSFGGPTLAALIARPGLAVEGLEQAAASGPLPVELVDGATAAVDHLADLDEHAAGTRRERLGRSITAVGAHTAALWERFAAGVAELDRVTVFGAAEGRLPAFALTVAGRTPAQVGEALDRRGISVWTGPSGLTQLLSAFGADELGGAVFAGFMPYTTPGEVDQLLRGLAALT